MHLVRPRSQSLISRRSIFPGFALLAALLASSLASSNACASLQIDGRCNIFGAGHAIPPAPAGGGGGLLPVEIALPSDAAFVRLSGISGSASCCGGAVNPNGPDGGDERGSGVDVFSFGGISGIRHSERYLFLTGVFVDATEPFGDEPARLDFSASALTDTFAELSPLMRQTFFIGDGLTPSGVKQIFHVPPGATRLILGMADAFAFTGDPGFFDDNGGSFTVDTIEVVPIAPANHDPDCSAATVSPSLLWPPRHQLVPVSIAGVTDPDGDPVTIAVTGVTQDEPVGDDDSHDDNVVTNLRTGSGTLDFRDSGQDDDHFGDHHHGDDDCRDAVISSSGEVSLRAERLKHSNGRVYVISFTASDGRGASCNGSVQVCVPHDADDLECVDDGQRFNAQDSCPRLKDRDDCHDVRAAAGITLATVARKDNATSLEYALPAAGDVRIGVYDIAGRQVAMLLHERQAAGVHRLDWTPAGLERGVYFCRLQAGSVTVTKSVLIMKR